MPTIETRPQPRQRASAYVGAGRREHQDEDRAGGHGGLDREQVHPDGVQAEYQQTHQHGHYERDE